MTESMPLADSFKANPEHSFRQGFETWWPTSGAEIREQFVTALMGRINERIPGFGQGRKWAYQWQIDALRAANAVNTPRLIVRWVPKDLRQRLAHRLTDE